jgi:hypothetical protein
VETAKQEYETPNHCSSFFQHALRDTQQNKAHTRVFLFYVLDVKKKRRDKNKLLLSLHKQKNVFLMDSNYSLL